MLKSKSPVAVAAQVKPFFSEGLVNVIGGCCGSSFPHIAELKKLASTFQPRQKHNPDQIMRISGLEPLNYVPSPTNMRDTFLYLGERCNVAGSIAYKKAIVDGDYDKATAIALSQVRARDQCCFFSEMK